LSFEDPTANITLGCNFLYPVLRVTDLIAFKRSAPKKIASLILICFEIPEWKCLD
jgi:hypothetical protein